MSAAEPVGFLRATWERWKKLAHAVGVVQTRLLMVVFFMVVVLPTGLLMRLTGDRLRLKKPADGNWVPHSDQEQDIETARRQF